MSAKSDQMTLDKFVGQRLISVETHECYQDQLTGSVTFVFKFGEVTLGSRGSRGFNDGSSCVNVD